MRRSGYCCTNLSQLPSPALIGRPSVRSIASMSGCVTIKSYINSTCVRDSCAFSAVCIGEPETSLHPFSFSMLRTPFSRKNRFGLTFETTAYFPDVANRVMSKFPSSSPRSSWSVPTYAARFDEGASLSNVMIGMLAATALSMTSVATASSMTDIEIPSTLPLLIRSIAIFAWSSASISVGPTNIHFTNTLPRMLCLDSAAARSSQPVFTGRKNAFVMDLGITANKYS
mmetsp:Transcript_22819/g.40691  ORF Transcript_22819/g.40691 Transcript_22819/m.40691 type:complete len:228 (-) Transcript_22819:288-971(-)